MRCGVVGYETAYNSGNVESNKLEGKLLNLDKLKFVVPEFEMKDLCMFEKIISLKWEHVVDIEDWTEHKNLFLEMDSADNYNRPQWIGKYVDLCVFGCTKRNTDCWNNAGIIFGKNGIACLKND